MSFLLNVGATLILCKLILLALVTFFRTAKINVFSCPKNKHLLFSKLTKIGVNFISSHHLRRLFFLSSSSLHIVQHSKTTLH